MKVWCYKLVAERELYAFTCTKSFKDLFEDFRDMKAFRKKSFNLDGFELEAFMSQNRMKKLIEIPLFNQDTQSYIIGTQQEEIELEESIEFLYNDTMELITLAQTSNLKKKYKKAICRLCDISEYTADGCTDLTPTIIIDEFKLFYTLNKRTFDASISGKEIENFVGKSL